MIRPASIWLLFAFCLTVLLAALGWITLTALRLETTQLETRRQAAFEEQIRLALWRIDSTLTPLIVQESSRPYFTYQPFFAAERAYNRMFSELRPDEVLLPSPLLDYRSTNILLHFQYGPDGRLTSPQIPLGNTRKLASPLVPNREQITTASARLAELKQRVDWDLLAAASTLPQPESAGRLPPPPVPQQQTAQTFAQALMQNILPPAADSSLEQAQQEDLRNTAELQARANTYQQAARANNDLNWSLSRGRIREGMVKPFWFGQALILARRVSVNDQDYLQGCWLDWENIRRWMLASVHDLLPAADLQPLPQAATGQDGRRLASLPAQLLPGTPPPSPAQSLSPVRFALAVAWLGLLLAGSAVALLLHGALSLSERRGAFVSAVTHELRTPLTTFRIYSEMLAEGMVQDPAKREHYLQTLHAEAHRLSHLVENVLAYARLERGRTRRQLEQLPLGQLLERIRPRLAQRTAQAGIALQTSLTPQTAQALLQVDASAVEQILFNLVDNACKYAAPNAREKIVHLEASLTHPAATLRVRDHGRGVPAEQARRLFRPFSKSAQEAAQSAPGVGLGLALARRLSRSLGGDLRLDRSVAEGACFVLSLPLSPPGQRLSRHPSIV